jgi:hypothetical protein
VLTVNGAFLTFLTTGLLASRSTAAQATAAFGPETWIFLAAMSVCLALGILSAVACLASRGLRPGQHRKKLQRYRIDSSNPGSHPPEVAAFFYDLTALEPRAYASQIMTADQNYLLTALASDAVNFAPYVLAKHRWVNRAFIFTGLTLGFFLATGASYLIRIHLAA